MSSPIQTKSHSVDTDKKSLLSIPKSLQKDDQESREDEEEGFEEGEENEQDHTGNPGTGNFFHRREGVSTVLVREMAKMNKTNKHQMAEVNRINKDSIICDRIFMFALIVVIMVFTHAIITSKKF